MAYNDHMTHDTVSSCQEKARSGLTECERFAAPGLCTSDEVAPLLRRLEDSLLDGKQRADAADAEGLDRLRAQAKVGHLEGEGEEGQGGQGSRVAWGARWTRETDVQRRDFIQGLRQ